MQQQLSRSMRQLEPLVRHGISELREGMSLEHTLREIALMGALIGAGATANQAIRTVERFEQQLLGGTGREAGETMYHGGMVQQGYGKPAVQGYVQPGVAMQGYGKPGVAVQGYTHPGVALQGYGKPGAVQQGYAVPTGYGKTGATYAPMAGSYGKQTYGPMGTTWMGK